MSRLPEDSRLRDIATSGFLSGFAFFFDTRQPCPMFLTCKQRRSNQRADEVITDYERTRQGGARSFEGTLPRSPFS